MKYIEKIAPTEVQHTVQISDTELKFILDLADCFAKHDASITINDQTFRPNDAGFDKLAGIVQMLDIVPLEKYDAGKFWTLFDIKLGRC